MIKIRRRKRREIDQVKPIMVITIIFIFLKRVLINKNLSIDYNKILSTTLKSKILKSIYSFPLLCYTELYTVLFLFCLQK